MRSSFMMALTALIVLGFIAYWCTFTVRFTEQAVVSTFGKATEASVRDDPRLYPKWPYPIQRVTKYDTRRRLLQIQSETQMTADDRQIIVEAFLAWRVDDPLKFYQRYNNAGPDARDHFIAANANLESLMRSAMASVSNFELRELFDPTPGASRLSDLERAILDRLTRTDDAGLRMAEYGVEPVLVGINRILLPQDTTREVFERMRATRQTIAVEAQTQGESLATTIRNEADAAADRILSFASRRAEAIRVTGDSEAARWLVEFNEEPELAVFLKQLEFMRQGLGRNLTLMLPTSLPGMSVFDPRLVHDGGAIPPFDPNAQPAAAAQSREESADR
ncbi:MAG: hypothetical protein EA379_08030 [Phycisphaerales bacterium]|nr:MAG: hypothetical protein EA379_08030 [Phycisphaerales bacterium]